MREIDTLALRTQSGKEFCHFCYLTTPCTGSESTFGSFGIAKLTICYEHFCFCRLKKNVFHAQKKISSLILPAPPCHATVLFAFGFQTCYLKTRQSSILLTFEKSICVC